MTSRNTEQLRIVREALGTLANHPTADEVYCYVHESYPAISKATVYRILNKLADNGDALRIKINNGADRFDHQNYDHYHVRCVVCGSVNDVMISHLSEIDRQAEIASQCHILGHEIQFDGICPKCYEATMESEVVYD